MSDKRKRNRKREPNWRMWTSILSCALMAIANDNRLKCRCGDGDYDDGEPCPKCFAMMQGESARDELRKHKEHVA